MADTWWSADPVAQSNRWWEADKVKSRDWADVPGEALSNLPKSAGNFVEAIAQPFLHPIDTAQNLGTLIASGMRLATPTPELQKNPEDLAPAKAVGRFFADRYGGDEQVKNTLATDPVGAAADIATLFTGGSALPGRAGMMAGKLAAMLDPISQTGNAVKLLGKGAEVTGSNVLGMTTGTGTAAIRQAARTGYEDNPVFRENMRGQVPMTDVIDMAHSAVDQMRQDRSADYVAGKANVAANTSPIPFADINQAADRATDIGTFRGQSGTAPRVTVEPAAAEVTGNMRGLIDAWQKLDPAEYHTPIGIDALKRALGNMRDGTLPHTPERAAAERIYNAVKDEISAKVPEYAGMMSDYAGASKQLNDITKTFSLGEKATSDTTLRKLQSVMRNNVQTNYGERLRLADMLAKNEPNLEPAIAGQALNSLAPRGIVARGAGVGGAGLAFHLMDPSLAAALLLTSPRIVGEAVHGGGRVAGEIGDIARGTIVPEGITAGDLRAAGQGTYQAGRADINERTRELARLLMRSNEQRGLRF